MAVAAGDQPVTVSGEYALLRDGGQVLIRPYTVGDRAAIEDFFARLSTESRGLRFHSAGARLSQDTLDLSTAGHALVAERGGRVVALASYYRLRDPERAE